MAQRGVSKKRGFPNEAGSIGEKVAKKWLEQEGYKVYFFQDIKEVFAELNSILRGMKRRRKKESIEKGQETIRRIEKFLSDIFDERLEDMKKFDKAIGELAAKEEKIRLAQDIKERRAIGFDFIANKDGKIFFVEVKVNQTKLGKYQRFSSQIIKEHGFKAMVLRVNIEIEIGKSIQFIECEQLYGEENG